jgi:hypothetical protein
MTAEERDLVQGVAEVVAEVAAAAVAVAAQELARVDWLRRAGNRTILLLRIR